LAKHLGERSYAAADAANEPRLALDNHTDGQPETPITPMA